ncbi:hypothetical protein BAE44_0005514, partial [Dichanthelium oligosanthes]
RRQQRRCRPGRDVLKINTDVNNVIRETSGQVISAGAGRCAYLMDTFHAKLLACLSGVRAAGEQGMSHAVIETDSMLVKLAIETGTFALAATRGIVYEIKT